MNLVEIADLLQKYKRARETIREIRVDITREAVNLGMDQKTAGQDAKALDFLDGYLVARGMIPSHRWQA